MRIRCLLGWHRWETSMPLRDKPGSLLFARRVCVCGERQELTWDGRQPRWVSLRGLS